MVVQVERIWLFETSLTDPYQFNTVDGVTCTMSSDRVVDNLNVGTATFYITSIAKAGLSYTKKYGGEDVDAISQYGKTITDFNLQFNLPLLAQETIERIVGREYSFLAMRRDLTYFVCFGRFSCDNLKIDNEVQQRVSFTSSNTMAKMYDVNSYNFDIIENEINITNPTGDDGGFDYVFDLVFD